jgi:hypothetical protein
MLVSAPTVVLAIVLVLAIFIITLVHLYWKLEKETKLRLTAEAALTAERLAAEAALTAERRINAAKTDLNHLCNENLVKNIKITEKSLSDIEMPSSVGVSSCLEAAVTNIVRTFNNIRTATTESNRSIRNARSVHNLWSNIFSFIRDSQSPTSTDCATRILYECSIPHPDTETKLRVDFLFILSAVCSPTWAQLRGGIELKNSPKHNESPHREAKGNLNKGFKQAVSRCARCVCARAEAKNWCISESGCEKSFMLYGDA